MFEPVGSFFTQGKPSKNHMPVKLSPSAQVPVKTCETIRQGALMEAGIAPRPEKIHNIVRDTYRKIRHWGIGWTVPLDVVDFKFEDGSVISVDYLHPRKLLQYLVAKKPKVIHGGNPDAIPAFWEAYQGYHDSHEAFLVHDDMTRVIPICLHGDEGRGKRRSQTTVVSWECCLGMTGVATQCSGCKPACLPEDPGNGWGGNPLSKELVCNLKGHSFLQHFPLFVLPGTWWKAYKPLTHKMLQRVASDFHDLFYQGFEVDGHRWHVAAVGSKGDLKWFSKICHFIRGFENKGKKTDVAHCHACLAGKPGLPAEDLGSSPCWVPTIYTERPWDEEKPPDLHCVPYDVDKPEAFYKHDTFHTLRLGIYRYFCGSVLFLLLNLGYLGPGDIDKKLEYAHGHFHLWQLASHKHAALRSFTKNLLCYKSAKSYPWFNCKGSDCALLLLWLRTFVFGILTEGVLPEHKQPLEVIRATCEVATDFYDMVVKHNMFLSRNCALTLVEKGKSFINGYCYLAKFSFTMQWCLFALVPKIHFKRHIVHELEQQLAQHRQLVLNPLVFDCSQNEDLIGRICRMGRKIDHRILGFRILTNYLIKAGILYDRAVKTKKKLPRPTAVGRPLRPRSGDH